MTVFDVWSTHSFVRHALHTEGTVLAFGVGGSAHPEISFVLPSGETSTFTVGTFIPYNPGERAPVLYLPEGRACLDDFAQLWMPHIVHFMFGFVFLSVGLSLLLNRPRVGGREQEAA